MIPVAEEYVKYIRIGEPVDVRVPSLDRSFLGRVSRFSVDVQADTRTMHTEVDVRNPDRSLVPGLYAEATLTLDTRDHVVTVPEEALNIEGNGRSVWVVDASNKVEKRPVTLGVETATDAEIVSGLKEGEFVAVGNRDSLKAGQTVRPKVVEVLQNQPQEE